MNNQSSIQHLKPHLAASTSSLDVGSGQEPSGCGWLPPSGVQLVNSVPCSLDNTSEIRITYLDEAVLLTHTSDNALTVKEFMSQDNISEFAEVQRLENCVEITCGKRYKVPYGYMEVLIPQNWEGSLSICARNGALFSNDRWNLSNFSADMQYGDIAIHSLSSDHITVSSTGGIIFFGRLAGHISIHTERASIALRQVLGGGEIRSHSGNINICLAALNSSVKVSSTTGSAHITIPRDYAFVLDAETAFGKIDSFVPEIKPGSDDKIAYIQWGKNPYLKILIRSESGNLQING